MDKMLLTILVLGALTLTLVKMGPADSTLAGPHTEIARSPAYFPHDAHMDIVGDCMACHHRYKDGRNVATEDELDGDEAMRCRTCHTRNDSVNASEAFHRQCIGCHREQGGPLTCGECHPNKIPNDAEALIIER